MSIDEHEPERIAEVCDAAADIIERDGWQQTQLWRGQSIGAAYEGGPVCLLGAVGVASGRIVRGMRAMSLSDPLDYDELVRCPAAAATAEQVGLPSTHSWDFNDADGRTAEQVVQALRDTATKHRPDAMRGGA